MTRTCQFHGQPSYKKEVVICEFFGKKNSLHYVNRFSRIEVFGTFGFLIQIGLCVMVNYFTRI